VRGVRREKHRAQASVVNARHRIDPAGIVGVHQRIIATPDGKATGWARILQFARIVNTSHFLRRVEITVRGSIGMDDGQPVLAAESPRPDLRLDALNPADKFQWSRAA
jgi:hypothetical protein